MFRHTFHHQYQWFCRLIQQIKNDNSRDEQDRGWHDAVIGTVDIQLELFDYLVLPILVYGCGMKMGVWKYLYIRQITPYISKRYIVCKTIDTNLHGAWWNRSFPIIRSY